MLILWALIARARREPVASAGVFGVVLELVGDNFADGVGSVDGGVVDHVLCCGWCPPSGDPSLVVVGVAGVVAFGCVVDVDGADAGFLACCFYVVVEYFFGFVAEWDL